MYKYIIMDDFVLSNLYESRNEWCSRLVSIFTPLVNQGIRSIFDSACKLCSDQGENEKYLMTFQNLLSHIPKWNSVTLEEECKRIIDRSGCNYLEDLISCVHVIQLKVLTCVRVGNKQKKIDISIPKLDTFVHKVYINVARRTYSNVYLFDKTASALGSQKNNREFEQIIQECILTTIRESIPTEQIIRAYMEESQEQEEEVIIEDLKDEEVKEIEAKQQEKEEAAESNDTSNEDEKPTVPAIANVDNEPVVTRLTFNDIDTIQNPDTGSIEEVDAPKTIERLEEISNERAIQRQLEEEEDLDSKIKIHTDNLDMNLAGLDILDIERSTPGNDQLLLEGIETLE